MRAEADVGRHLATTQLDQGVERGSEAIAVIGIDAVQPPLDGPAKRSSPLAQTDRKLIGNADAIAFDIPVEDKVTRPSEGECSPLNLAERTDRDLALREGVLHRGEAQQHHDQNETTGNGRLRDVV